jgi:hypothetical protein
MTERLGVPAFVKGADPGSTFEASPAVARPATDGPGRVVGIAERRGRRDVRRE